MEIKIFEYSYRHVGHERTLNSFTFRAEATEEDPRACADAFALSFSAIERAVDTTLEQLPLGKLRTRKQRSYTERGGGLRKAGLVWDRVWPRQINHVVLACQFSYNKPSALDLDSYQPTRSNLALLDALMALKQPQFNDQNRARVRRIFELFEQHDSPPSAVSLLRRFGVNGPGRTDA